MSKNTKSEKERYWYTFNLEYFKSFGNVLWKYGFFEIQIQFLTSLQFLTVDKEITLGVSTTYLLYKLEALMLLSLLILLILVFEQLEQSGYHPWWTLKVQPSFQDWLLQSKIHQNSPLLFQILVQNDLCPRMRFDYFCDIMICSSDIFTNVMFWHYQSTKLNVVIYVHST